MKLDLRTPSQQEFQQIRNYIAEFELDNRQLEASQFIAAFREGVLVGFGRLRVYGDCTELCSLGVITPVRRKGIGSRLVQSLVGQAASDIYLVCIIPDFFIPLGFQITGHYPAPLLNKLQYCISELTTPEKYVVMVKRGQA